MIQEQKKKRMIDKVQKIREKVVWLMSNHDSALDYEAALEDVLNIIDTMQEKPVSEQKLSNFERTGKNWKEEPVSEDLDVIAREYAGIPCDAPKDLTYCVHDKKAKYDAVLFGSQWQKQQMIKNAFPAEIGKQRSDYKCVLHGNFFKHNAGDKVKLIII